MATKDADDLPNGAGQGDTSSDASDTTSGGKPEQSSPPSTENADGTPVDNPSGG